MTIQPIGVGVHVECGSSLPPRLFPNEAVVAQVVILVTNQNIEQNPPEKLGGIFIDVEFCSSVSDEFSQIQLTCAQLAIVPFK